jgi:hypothetical protein
VQRDGPDCRDFIFVTEDIADRVRQAAVGVATAASDHQPVLIEIAHRNANRRGKNHVTKCAINPVSRRLLQVLSL